MENLKLYLQKGIKVRRKLTASGNSAMNLGDLTENVAYWIAMSKNVLKTALNKREEILIVLPPNFRGRFLEMIKSEK